MHLVGRLLVRMRRTRGFLGSHPVVRVKFLQGFLQYEIVVCSCFIFPISIAALVTFNFFKDENSLQNGS